MTETSERAPLIHLRAECRARLTESWRIDAPPDWHHKTKAERRAWLTDSLHRAEYRDLEEIHDEEGRTLIDYVDPPVSRLVDQGGASPGSGARLPGA